MAGEQIGGGGVRFLAEFPDSVRLKGVSAIPPTHDVGDRDWKAVRVRGRVRIWAPSVRFERRGAGAAAG